MPENRWELNWPFGRATVRARAAMLWDCQFTVRSGRKFSPFARAPWAEDDAVDASLPAHIRHLGGEFVCIPFGMGGSPRDLLPAWASESWDKINPVAHGESADLSWSCVSSDESRLVLRLDYPPEHDIDYLIRSLTAVEDRPALDMELTIHVRRRTRQPVGLHPILRLPEQLDALEIDAQFEFGLTYPAFVPPGVSRVRPGQRFDDLGSISGIHGGSVDYRTLPKQGVTEEMLMLCNVQGPVAIRYPLEKVQLLMTWDTSQLPCCLLWPSDRSLQEPPWNGTFRGIGVEPNASVFDAAREVALEANPFNSAGVATAIDLEPDRPLTIRYRFEAADIQSVTS